MKFTGNNGKVGITRGRSTSSKWKQWAYFTFLPRTSNPTIVRSSRAWGTMVFDRSVVA